MSTELARRDTDAFELGKVFAESGMFPNVRKAAEAVVKIIAGREFGLGPMAAMNGIHMVDGKPTLAANLIAGQIKRHPKYDYRVVRRDDTGCTLLFLEDGKPCQPDGHMTFDKKDAERAGLLSKQNWRKYPRDMYFARCLTAGARTFCPDVLGGSPIYTAEELGADDAATGVAPVVEGADAGERGAGVDEPPAAVEPEIADAEVVETTLGVDGDVLAGLRRLYVQSGMTHSDLAWFLLSVGVTDLPENPSQEDVGAAMRGLTLDQALQLETILKQACESDKGEGEGDDSIPGSGETA